jgi:hypothetical protein
MTEAAEKYGQGWIRTSEGVKPADLQSAPFGHFGTYPLARGISYILAPYSLQLALAFSAVDSTKRNRYVLRWRFCAAFFGSPCSLS